MQGNRRRKDISTAIVTSTVGSGTHPLLLGYPRPSQGLPFSFTGSSSFPLRTGNNFHRRADCRGDHHKSATMGHVMGKLSDILSVDCRFPINGDRESRILMLGLDAAGNIKLDTSHYPFISYTVETERNKQQLD